jgi:hypothetical protein
VSGNERLLLQSDEKIVHTADSAAGRDCGIVHMTLTREAFMDSTLLIVLVVLLVLFGGGWGYSRYRR